jgi:molybdopterin converting factor small subunit
MATVMIPKPLQKFANCSSKVTVNASKVSDVLLQLTASFPDLKRYLMNPDGRTTSFITIFVDSDDIRNLNREQTSVNAETVISIIPAIAGGIQYP